MCGNGRNKISGKSKIDYIVVAFVIAIVLLTIVRIFTNTTQNAVRGFSGVADGRIQMADARYLELELDAPMSGVTGFGFQFEGDREKFEGARFLVNASIQNDSLNPQILFEQEMPLIEQAYDYQNECYKVIVPFKGDIQQGDHLRIAIMGMGISEEDDIFVKTSSRSGIAGATFEINDFVQDHILAGNFYYQTKELNIFPALIQGIIFILLIILAGEIWKKPRRKRKPEVKSQKLPIRKRIRSIVPVIILLVIALDYTYYAGIRTQIQAIKPKDNVQIYQGENAAYRKLCDGEAAFFECSVEENNFGGFGISLKEPYDDNGILTIEVNDLESQKLVASTKRAVYELKEDKGGFLKFDFDSPVKKSEGKEYIVSIYYSGSEPIEMLMADGINNPRLIPLYQENIFLNVLFIILSIFIIVFTLVIALCEQKGMKLEKFFLIAVVFLGILFQIVITPFAVPDEAAHIDTAYRLSNQILGVEDSKIKDAIYKRECDIWTDSGIKRTIDVESYRWIYEDWFSTEGNNSTRLIFAADVTPNANILYFLPAAIGITVGRILGIGFLPTIFLARTFNLLLAAWLIYQAVKKLPFGKSILCAVALLPLTIQEIASCSYDALIIAVSVLYVSYCVFAIYSRKNLERADILVIVITAIMLGICKGGVYTPLYLLGIWILVKRGYIRLPQRKGAKVAGIAVAACLALGGIIGVVYLFMQPVDPYSLRNGYYPLAYLFQHPWEIVRIFENTINKGIYKHLEQLVGGGMGCFQISLKFLVPIGYAMLLGAAVISSEKYPYIVNTPNKCVFLTAAGMSFAAIYVAFLVTCTTFGDTLIRGIQGRYFIPLLWLLLISLRSGRTVNKKKKYRKIVTMGYALGIAAVLQVVIETLGPVG